MTRLFLSLYAFITITLVVLSAVLSYFFIEEPEQDPSRQQLIASLSLLHQQAPLSSSQLKKIGIEGRIINTGDMPWSAQDKLKLEQQEAVILFGDKHSAHMYLRVNNKQLLEIDLPSSTPHDTSFYWYSALFFMFLAIGVAIWLWPLWRDLQALKHAAKQTDLSIDYKATALPHTSLVYPIGQSLDELNNKVRELIKTQMELTGAVAHEFRTPLARLKFALEAIKTNNEGALFAINLDIQELEKLMHEMLSYTSLENQEPELSISQIPLLSLCEQRVEMIKRGTFEQSELNINIQVAGDNATVLADEHYIERAVDNLLQNAVRHAKRKVCVYVHQQDNLITLSIDDDGAGIDAQHQEKIFEPFYRPDASRNRRRGGAGLGLAIVKRIAKWHQCECWFETSNIGGARFCISFSKVAK